LLSTAVNIGVRLHNYSDEDRALKALTLALNSSLTMLQLLGFLVETRGDFIDLHGRMVWSHVHVPDIRDEVIRESLSEAFDKVSALVEKHRPLNLFERLRSRDELQKAIDKAVIKAVRLNKYVSIEELQVAVYRELEMLRKVFESTRKRAKRRITKKKQKVTRALEEFFSGN